MDQGETSGRAPETIPIRADEDFDHHRVAAYLEGKLPGSDRALRIEQFGGGHANLTYLLQYGEQEYVLRRPPLGPVAAGAHDMGREYRVLSVLHRVYPLAPRALLFCADPAIIGAPFLVMERRRGTVVRAVVPPEFGGGGDPGTNRRLSEVMIDALADLHQADYRAVGLETLGKPEGFLRRQIEGWAQRYARAKTADVRIVDELVGWLCAEQPASPSPTLVHNDWRLDNMMLDPQDAGRVVAVFDWDMCTLGDPLADLGTLLGYWVEAGEEPTVELMPSDLPGFLTRRAAVERYAQRRGIDVSAALFYYVFGLFKAAVVMQQIYYRFHVGQTQDARFAVFGQRAEQLFRLATDRYRTGVL
ncbi:MAG: phosphotransferase family protein [Candidatus Binatia bacterium]